MNSVRRFFEGCDRWSVLLYLVVAGWSAAIGVAIIKVLFFL